ncbi:MAG: ATP synthase subunit I [Proteobacteria bacterium]|nr:ATP synthase subunit I [Pseudomonadota bacterium]
MGEQGNGAGQTLDQIDDLMIVRKVTVASMVLLVVLVAGGYLLQGWVFARSMLVGGLLVNGSFWLMQKDTRRLLRRIGEVGGDGVLNIEKTRFLLRSFGRLVVVGLLLFVLASWMPIDPIGLVVGFATVMVSVVIIGLGAGRRWLPDKV